jgi:hypothetical protein
VAASVAGIALLSPAKDTGTTYVKPFVRVPDCALGFVTVTFFAPTVPAGVFAVRVVLLTKATPLAAVAPTVTVAPLIKLLPLIVMAVPPLVLPQLGVTDNTSGAGAPTVLVKLSVIISTGHGKMLVWPAVNEAILFDTTSMSQRVSALTETV